MKTTAFLTGILIIAGLAFSCNGQKATVADETNDSAMEETPFDPTGYTKGKIVQNRNAVNEACEWLIETEDGRRFETTDMTERHKVSNAAIYFQYRGLRRMSVCGETTPVTITEMRMIE